MNRERIERILKYVFKYVLLFGTIIFVLFIILSFLKTGFIFWFYERVFDWISIRLGLDYYLALFISLSATAFFSASLPYLAWTFLLGRRQYTSSLIVIGMAGLMCLLVYTVGTDIYFDRRTGEPLKYYADTPNGRTFSHTPGYDPKYGIPYKIYSQAVRLEEVKERKKKEQIIEEQKENQIIEKKKTTIIKKKKAEREKSSTTRSAINQLPANAKFVKTLAPGEIIVLRRERMDIAPPERWVRNIRGKSYKVSDWPPHEEAFYTKNTWSENADLFVVLPPGQSFITSRGIETTRSTP